MVVDPYRTPDLVAPLVSELHALRRENAALRLENEALFDRWSDSGGATVDAVRFAVFCLIVAAGSVLWALGLQAEFFMFAISVVTARLAAATFRRGGG